MKTLILAAALVGSGPTPFDTSPPPASVTELPPIVTPKSTTPPPTSEALATRADIEALATKLHNILMPMEDRLHAVEQESARVAAQLRELNVSHDQTIADLKASRAELAKLQTTQRMAPPPQAPAPPPKAAEAVRERLWTLDDADHKAWVDTDRERLKRLVREENAKIAARKAAAAPAVSYAAYASAPVYQSMPTYAAAPVDYGWGAAFTSSPAMGAMSFGGSFSAGCPGGNCSTGFR